MLKNLVLVALRHLRRQKAYALLNVAGLAMGMACAALILSYVQLEWSFDRFHADAGRLYRVVQQQPGNVFLGSDRFAVVPAGLAEALRDDVSEVEGATLFAQRPALVEAGGRRFVEPGLRADPTSSASSASPSNGAIRPASWPSPTPSC